MNVALYHPWIYLKGGIERTLVELTARSRHRWSIFTSHHDPDGTFAELRERHIVELDRVAVDRDMVSVARAAARIARTRLPAGDHDAVVVCCDGLGSLLNFGLPAVPVACLCFTPLRAVYDPEYRDRQQPRSGARRIAWALAERAYRLVDRRAWRRYDHVFCISDTVRRRVVAGGLHPGDDIELAHPGIDASAIHPSRAHEPFFFLPGRIMWTKNIELGVQAFLRLWPAAPAPMRLVIAGMVDGKSAPYLSRIQSMVEGRDDVSFVIDPGDAEMADLYERCHATLFTAFNEDWGLTPLEAMRHGKPVIAVARGGPTEVVLDGRTGFLAEPDAAAFAAAMRRVVDDPALAQAMGTAGLERARMFTWQRFVHVIDDGLERMVTRRPAD